MTQVGVNASDKKCDRGNQNQNWVKTKTPTTEGMWVCPVLDCSEMVTLWPPVRNYKSLWIIHSWVLQGTWAMNLKQLLSKGCTGQARPQCCQFPPLEHTFLLYCELSLLSKTDVQHSDHTFLQYPNTIREYSPSSMLILPGYRLDKSTGSERGRKRQTFVINSFKPGI